MPTFRDRHGAEWLIDIEVSAIKRVRRLAGVDLLEVLDGRLIDRLMVDDVLLVDIVYALCRPQAEQRGVSDEDFGRAMSGDAIEQATRALLEGLVAFCRSPRKRQILGRAIEKVEAAMEAALDEAQREIERIDPGRIVARAPEPPGTRSTDAPASSASTPDPSPSGS